MASRIPPLPPEERSDEVQELLAAVATGDGDDVLNIFATLARHPRLLKRWMAFGGTLLLRGVLPPRDRELVILRTAYRCRAEYEWGQHTRIARESGLDDDEIARVAEGPDADGWDDADAALLRAVDELRDQAVISDATWAELAARYDERQLIELPMLVGQYHLVAFALNSLGVEREEGVEGFPA
jgi:4-carboxymuconolactone decarboxylase